MDNEVIVSAAHYEPKLDIIIPCVRHADSIFLWKFYFTSCKFSWWGIIRIFIES